MLDVGRSVSAAADAPAAEAGPLVQLHVELSRRVWRIAPAWAVLAGALAARAWAAAPDAWLRLAAAVVLADLAWGILRKVIAGRQDDAALAPAVLGLPYAQPAGPLMRFLRALGAGSRIGQPGSRTAWQELSAGLALTIALSWLLGGSAALLSLGAVGVILLGWALARRGSQPALCLAALDVALSWFLGASLAWHGRPFAFEPSWFWLAAAFTALQWGVHRFRLSGGRRRGGLWLGQVTVLAVMVGLRLVWPLGVTAALFAPPSWWLAGRGAPAATLVLSQPWWWAAMLLAAGVAGLSPV